MLRVQGRRRWGFGGSGYPGFDSYVPRLAIFAIIYRQEGLFMVHRALPGNAAFIFRKK